MTVTIHHGDCRAILPTLAPQSVQTVVTSPPYFGLRDYGVDGQIGLEATPADYVAALVDVFRAVRRVLRDDGTVWLNLGDSYANDTKWGGTTSGKHVRALHGGSGIGRRRTGTGLPSKSLIGIPWRVAFALQDDGWILRSDIVWNKPDAMPESVTDRPTRSHEYIFLLSKRERYVYDAAAIAEPAVKGSAGSRFDVGKTGITGLGRVSTQERQERDTRNKRTVWTVPTARLAAAHFATFPSALIEPCILAGSRPGDVVLDPFFGSGTTGRVAVAHGRSCIGIDLNADYIDLAAQRTSGVQIHLEAAS